MFFFITLNLILMLLEINMASASVSRIILRSLLQNTIRNLQRMELVRAFRCIYIVALYRARKRALMSFCSYNWAIIYPYGWKWAVVFSYSCKQAILSPCGCNQALVFSYGWKQAIISPCWSIDIVKRRVQLLVYSINQIQILGSIQSSSYVISSR